MQRAKQTTRDCHAKQVKCNRNSVHATDGMQQRRPATGIQHAQQPRCNLQHATRNTGKKQDAAYSSKRDRMQQTALQHATRRANNVQHWSVLLHNTPDGSDATNSMHHRQHATDNMQQTPQPMQRPALNLEYRPHASKQRAKSTKLQLTTSMHQQSSMQHAN
jgi:hypothetical protein